MEKSALAMAKSVSWSWWFDWLWDDDSTTLVFRLNVLEIMFAALFRNPWDLKNSVIDTWTFLKLWSKKDMISSDHEDMSLLMRHTYTFPKGLIKSYMAWLIGIGLQYTYSTQKYYNLMHLTSNRMLLDTEGAGYWPARVLGMGHTRHHHETAGRSVGFS